MKGQFSQKTANVKAFSVVPRPRERERVAAGQVRVVGRRLFVVERVWVRADVSQPKPQRRRRDIFVEIRYQHVPSPVRGGIF